MKYIENRRFNRRELKNYRRELRNNATEAEKRLWEFLKNKQLDGRKFRRQVSIDFFILDFYCFPEKLAIEVDGGYHDLEEVISLDLERTKLLNLEGIRVIRFNNEEIMKNIESVLEQIKDCFTQ